MNNGFIRPILSLVVLFVVLFFLGFDIRDVVNEEFFLNIWEKIQELWMWLTGKMKAIF